MSTPAATWSSRASSTPSITDYLEVPGGEYQIQVVPSGATLEEGPVVIDAPLTFDAGTMTTVAATGSLAAGIIPQVLADAPAPTADGSQVRVVHFSFDAPAVDVAPDGGDALITDLAFPNNTGYVDLPAGAYDLEIRAAGTDTVAFDIPEVTLRRRAPATPCSPSAGWRTAASRSCRPSMRPWPACVSVTSRPMPPTSTSTPMAAPS